MECSCSLSEFCYGPAGHDIVITGDLRIIKDGKVRELFNKGPSYREQNNIDWSLNATICKEAVTKYKVKWLRRLGIDRRVLNEWEKKVHEAIDRRVVQGLIFPDTSTSTESASCRMFFPPST